MNIFRMLDEIKAHIDMRFDALEKQYDAIEKRVTNLEKKNLKKKDV